MLSRWVQDTQGARLPVGISAQEASRRAEPFLNEDLPISTLSNEQDQPDVIHALVEHLRIKRPDQLAPRCGEFYRWLLDARDFEFDESQDLLGEFSYLAWSDELQRNRYLERDNWAARCEKHSKAQGAVRDFLALPVESRTSAITDRFLREGYVRVAYCLDLKGKVDRSPAIAVDEAIGYYNWVIAQGGAIEAEETTYLAGRAALFAGGGSRVIGRRAESRMWLSRAQDHFDRLDYAEPDLSILAYNRLALAYDSGSYELPLRETEHLKATFERLSMKDYTAKIDFLRAMVLKSVGRIGESEAVLRGVGSATGTADSAGLRGLALVNLGELAGAQGRHAEALRYFSEAAPLVVRAPWCFSRGNFVGSLGEVLRRAGEVEQAFACYRAALDYAASTGLSAIEAYIRVILAEMLLEQGSVAEAQEQIVAALPTISAERMVREGIAAIALLKESLARHELSPTVVRAVQNCLADCDRRQTE